MGAVEYTGSTRTHTALYKQTHASARLHTSRHNMQSLVQRNVLLLRFLVLCYGRGLVELALPVLLHAAGVLLVRLIRLTRHLGILGRLMHRLRRAARRCRCRCHTFTTHTHPLLTLLDLDAHRRLVLTNVAVHHGIRRLPHLLHEGRVAVARGGRGHTRLGEGRLDAIGLAENAWLEGSLGGVHHVLPEDVGVVSSCVCVGGGADLIHMGSELGTGHLGWVGGEGGILASRVGAGAGW
mmetsp:Transcript_45587/g.128709  ORF Transcript_45587/g.128709 Transcript_45587/m.128709 type:complete len:238 (-) Transcript_45587:572-1285(-)